MGALRSVTVVVTATTTGESYLALSYPSRDRNGNGNMEVYRVPVYRIEIKGSDAAGKPSTVVWKGLRFMPYFNDPKNPDRRYSALGWATAGLRSLPKKAVERYDPNYGTHNRPSPFSGAIQMKNSFLIHAGPQALTEHGWGSAGCVEVIGDFDKFKTDIKVLSGLSNPSVHDALSELVRARQLFVQVDPATPPKISNNVVSDVVPVPRGF